MLSLNGKRRLIVLVDFYLVFLFVFVFIFFFTTHYKIKLNMKAGAVSRRLTFRY